MQEWWKGFEDFYIFQIKKILNIEMISKILKLWNSETVNSEYYEKEKSVWFLLIISKQYTIYISKYTIICEYHKIKTVK